MTGMLFIDSIWWIIVQLIQNQLSADLCRLVFWSTNQNLLRLFQRIQRTVQSALPIYDIMVSKIRFPSYIGKFETIITCRFIEAVSYMDFSCANHLGWISVFQWHQLWQVFVAVITLTVIRKTTSITIHVTMHIYVYWVGTFLVREPQSVTLIHLN